MELMKNYSDLINEIECIKLEIKLTKKEYEYWSGVKMLDKQDDGLLLSGSGVYKTKTRIQQMDRVAKSLEKLNERLEYHQEYKERMDKLMQQFTGLEYKVAYKKWVEMKKIKEIASDLGYTEQYIKEISAKLNKTYKHPTEILRNA